MRAASTPFLDQSGWNIYIKIELDETPIKLERPLINYICMQQKPSKSYIRARRREELRRLSGGKWCGGCVVHISNEVGACYIQYTM